METSFHYALYRPIITALQAQGQGCTLVINDRVFKPFLDEMLETLKASTIRSSKECAYLKCRHTVSG